MKSIENYKVQNTDQSLAEDQGCYRSLEHIIEEYSDGYFTLSKEGSILAFNSKAQRLLGIPENLILNADFWSLFPAEKNDQLSRQLAAALSHHEPIQFEGFYPHLNKWFETTIYPDKDRATLFFKDITLRKNQQAELLHLAQDYELLFANNPLPMWAYDINNLKILMVNNAALTLYGYLREEFLSLDLFDLRPEEEHERLKNELESKDILKELRFSQNWQHQKKDGSVIYVEISSHRILLNDRSARLIVVNNMTASRKAQNTLLKQNTRLREIAQLSSHDLRGPVASILGLVSLFDEDNLDIHLNNQIISNLKISAELLDKVIHTIVKKTYDEDL